MKKMLLLLTAFAFSAMLGITARAEAREGYIPVAQADFDRLTITSFSEHWDADGIAALYEELLRNIYSDELALLSDIYLYPDSPEGVAGQYFEDISYQNGVLTFGDGAYIELFSMDKRRTVLDAAPVLAHEYGHHYTIVNITKAEKRYWSDWGQSRYGALRGLSDAPLGSSYIWDVTEIAAWDYVQLLASPNARQGFNYPDALDKLVSGDAAGLSPTMFNKRPQDNAALPLASQTDGLYSYLLAVGGYTAAPPSIAAAPVITSITAEESFLNPQYTITWTPAEGAGAYTYTVVMFPAAYPFLVEPVKTVSDGEALSAVFGTVTRDKGNGETAAVLDYYAGDYMFVVYAQDEKGFIFASEPLLYAFGHDYFDTLAYMEPDVQEAPDTSAEADEAFAPVTAEEPVTPAAEQLAQMVFMNPIREKQKVKLMYNRVAADTILGTFDAVQPPGAVKLPARSVAKRDKGFTTATIRRIKDEYGIRLSHSYGGARRY